MLFDYYVAPEISLGRHWILEPSLHYAREKYKYLQMQYDSSELIGIDALPLSFKDYYYAETEKEAIYDQFIGGFSLTRRIGSSHSLNAGLSYQHISDTNNLHAQIGFSSIILKNKALFITGRLNYFRKSEENLFVYQAKLGAYILPKIRACVYGQYGDIRGLALNNGALLYSSPDAMQWATGLNASMALLESHFNIHCNYRISAYEADCFINTTHSARAGEKDSYLNHRFSLGISWQL